MLEPRVGSPMHALWPLWERRIKRSIAAKSEAQLASLEMPPTLRTLGLARIGRIADTDPTTIAREPVKQLRDTALAEGAMEPRPQTPAEMATGPRNADLLRNFARHFQLERVSIGTDFCDIRPAKRRPAIPFVSEQPKAAKGPDVQAITA
jgi:hypothetical protein